MFRSGKQQAQQQKVPAGWFLPAFKHAVWKPEVLIIYKNVILWKKNQRNIKYLIFHHT